MPTPPPLAAQNSERKAFSDVRPIQHIPLAKQVGVVALEVVAELDEGVVGPLCTRLGALRSSRVAESTGAGAVAPAGTVPVPFAEPRGVTKGVAVTTIPLWLLE
jgi:hypothetical protein